VTIKNLYLLYGLLIVMKN